VPALLPAADTQQPGRPAVLLDLAQRHVQVGEPVGRDLLGDHRQPPRIGAEMGLEQRDQPGLARRVLGALSVDHFLEEGLEHGDELCGALVHAPGP